MQRTSTKSRSYRGTYRETHITVDKSTIRAFCLQKRGGFNLKRDEAKLLKIVIHRISGHSSINKRKTNCSRTEAKIMYVPFTHSSSSFSATLYRLSQVSNVAG